MSTSRFFIRMQVLALALSFLVGSGRAQNAKEMDEIRWTFDAASDNDLVRMLAGRGDHLEGYWSKVPGTDGCSLEFDGYTTGVRRDASKVSRIGGEFTVSAWVAMDNIQEISGIHDKAATLRPMASRVFCVPAATGRILGFASSGSLKNR